jgi:hypothetical protein
MNEWHYAQTDPRERLARLHHFSINRLKGEKEIEMVITIKETYTPTVGTLQYFAQADKQTNQKSAPYTPSGWDPGNQSFPYEG